VCYCNTKIGIEEVFKPVTGNWGLQETSNANETRAIDFATNNNIITESTYFLRIRNVHKETWQSPDGRNNNEIDLVLVDGRNESSVMGVRICRGADCDWDRHFVRINIDRKYQSKKKKRHMVQDKGSETLKCYRIRKL
jgi:CTP:phosphocholine cytidylyltransferase-like protein